MPSLHNVRGEYHALVDPESRRLAQDAQRLANWKRWGPYLSERQWGTVREDYSPSGESSRPPGVGTLCAGQHPSR